jgi:hypothetical protein
LTLPDDACFNTPCSCAAEGGHLEASRWARQQANRLKLRVYNVLCIVSVRPYYKDKVGDTDGALKTIDAAIAIEPVIECYLVWLDGSCLTPHALSVSYVYWGVDCHPPTNYFGCMGMGL